MTSGKNAAKISRKNGRRKLKEVASCASIERQKKAQVQPAQINQTVDFRRALAWISNHVPT
jgi:hypothetical protein